MEIQGWGCGLRLRKGVGHIVKFFIMFKFAPRSLFQYRFKDCGGAVLFR